MILVAFAYIAAALVIVWCLLVALEALAPDVARGWFGQAAEDNEAQEQARTYLGESS